MPTDNCPCGGVYISVYISDSRSKHKICSDCNSVKLMGHQAEKQQFEQRKSDIRRKFELEILAAIHRVEKEIGVTFFSCHVTPIPAMSEYDTENLILTDIEFD